MTEGREHAGGYYKVIADSAGGCWHVYGPPGSTGATEDTEGEERGWLATFHDGEALDRFLAAWVRAGGRAFA